MKLEDQLVNPVLSKKIDGLGFKQDSCWYYVMGELDKKVSIIQGEPEESTMLNLEEPVDGTHYIQKIGECHSAFTVAELGELLPESLDLVSNPDGKSWLSVTKITNIKGKVVWTVGYGDLKGAMYLFETANTEADARAKVLIFLKECDYI